MPGMKVVLAGAGDFSVAWGKRLRERDDVDLVGWVSRTGSRAAQRAQDSGFPGIYTGEDLASALALLKPDFVIDVTPPEVHHEVTLTALRAGVAVLGEKPMAASMAQAREMVHASEDAGKLYMVSQSRRYDPRLAAFRKLIDQIGPPGMLYADFFIGAHFGGFREQMDHILLIEMAIHTFDAARYLTGADPVSVVCEEFNPAWSWFQAGASVHALFEMTGGLRFNYRGCWCADGKMTPWESEWRAVGPQGTALWDGVSSPQGAVVFGPDGFHSVTRDRSEAPGEGPWGISGALDDFLHALSSGSTPMGECHDNIKILAMVYGAIEAAESGRRVDLSGWIS